MHTGQITWYTVTLVPCPGKSNHSWHRVNIEVRAVLASILIDGTLLMTLEPFHGARGQVGVIATHGGLANVYFWPPELKSKERDYGACVIFSNGDIILS